MRKLIVQIIFLIIVTQLTSQTVYTGLNVPYDPCNPCSGANITYGATTYFNQPNQVADRQERSKKTDTGCTSLLSRGTDDIWQPYSGVDMAVKAASTLHLISRFFKHPMAKSFTRKIWSLVMVYTTV